MGQSHFMSIIETVSTSVSGFVVMTAAQVCVFPFFGLHLPLHENVTITAIMVSIAMVHRYFYRRLFDWIERKWKISERRNSPA